MMELLNSHDVREIGNGILAVSTTCILGLLVLFLLIRRAGEQTWEWRWRQEGWWRDDGVRFGGALTVLLFGHWLRAFPAWIQFIIDENVLARPMASATDVVTVLFIPAALITLVGKLLCAFTVGPGEWAWHLLFLVALISLGVPALVHWLI